MVRVVTAWPRTTDRVKDIGFIVAVRTPLFFSAVENIREKKDFRGKCLVRDRGGVSAGRTGLLVVRTGPVPAAGE